MVVVVVAVDVVVEDPPQAASDNAIIEMPPALAAFLAFLDSQALTSLLVAFIIFGYEKCIGISRANNIISRQKQDRNKKLNIG